MAVAAAQAAAALAAADSLRVMTHERWLEEHADYSSVEATLHTGEAAGRWARLRAHLTHYGYVAH